ncbi:MAG: hypothetical protein JW779_08740 [Candidatus Thorarchaeota archaeon]|nr:hypothetical protein [Candidatus Thorarchaeota archaeon]
MITYTNIRYTDFYSFFNVSEVSREKKPDGSSLVRSKPGGFQEFIDIEFMIDRDDYLKEAILWLDRQWIGDENNLNVFAKDIAKSFIHDTIGTGLQDQIEPIVQMLFNVKGGEDHVITLNGDGPPSVDEVGIPELRQVILTFAGLESSWSLNLYEAQIHMENVQIDERYRLRISVCYQGNSS